jgi:hypothetical protein
MTDIVLGAMPQLWRDLIREGETRAGARLAEDCEAYLVFTLMRHCRDAPLAHRTMALELLDALSAAGRARDDQLRDVGDRCLLIAGLYPELANRRRVDLGYFVGLGRGAYRRLGDRPSLGPLFNELAERFAALVRVLLAVRMLSASGLKPDPFALHELALADGAGIDPQGQVHVPAVVTRM